MQEECENNNPSFLTVLSLEFTIVIDSTVLFITSRFTWVILYIAIE